MINLPIDLSQLNQIQKKAKTLKRGFSKTEQKAWNLSSFAAELLFQTIHLLDAVNAKYFTKFSTPTDKRIEDEIADILFNIMNILNILNLSVRDILAEDKINKYFPVLKKNILCQTINLCINSGILWDSTFRLENYKHKTMTNQKNKNFIQDKISEILVLLLFLAQKLKIDIIKAFSTMERDAKRFLNNYEHKYKIR